MHILFADLESVSEDLVHNGIRRTTSRAYSTAQKQFLQFCQALRLQPLPTTEQTLLTYVAYLYKKGLTPNSVNVYLSAVRNLNIVNGFAMSEFRTPRIKLATKAILERSKAPVQKVPLTFDKLMTLWPVIKNCKYALTWKAVISLAFFGGLRCAEYTPSAECPLGPTVDQVQFSADSKVLLYSVKKFKTKVHGFVCRLGCSKSEICARCNMIQYLFSRNKQAGIQNSDPLFLLDNMPVSSEKVNKFMKSIVKSVGWDVAEYSAHSLRAGAASTAARAGFSDWELKALGGWKSATYMEYIRDNTKHTDKFPRRMARV